MKKPKLAWRQQHPRVYWCYHAGNHVGAIFGPVPPRKLWHYMVMTPGGLSPGDVMERSAKSWAFAKRRGEFEIRRRIAGEVLSGPEA